MAEQNGLVIITGASGGLGQEVTTALAKEGYSIIMACRSPETAYPICNQIKELSGNDQIEVRSLDLACLDSVFSFTEQLITEGRPVLRLINNAGVLTTNNPKTKQGLNTITCVNYIAHYLLTRRIVSLMPPGARIVNTTSCTHIIGKIDKNFFEKGKDGKYNRFAVYANSKLALILFTQKLAKEIKEQDIIVNIADPGIVNTNMIKMNSWFDPLTDILFRPLIKTRQQGASTTIHLATSTDMNTISGSYFANCKKKIYPQKGYMHPAEGWLWEETEKKLISLGYQI